MQNAPLVTGWVFFNPLSETIVEFPVNVQNVVWTKDTNEGSPVDESITFASSEGVTVNADVGLAFHIDGQKAPRLYARFRESDVNVLAHGYVRNVVREALGEVASTMPVQEIYGAGKTRLIREAQRIVSEKLTPDGFVIDQLTFASALRLPRTSSTRSTAPSRRPRARSRRRTGCARSAPRPSRPSRRHAARRRRHASERAATPTRC